MGRPELLGTVRRDEFVVRILEVSHVEGWVAGIQHKEYSSKGEQINDLTLIGLFCVDFRSHEAERSDDRTVHTIASSAFHGASEAKIDNFDVV